MSEFKEPKIEMIQFSEDDMIVTSSQCTQGLQNTGWECEGNVKVTCPNASSKAIQS